MQNKHSLPANAGKKLPKIDLIKKPTYLKFAEGLDVFELFSKIEAEFKTCFILESLGEQSDLSRYSIIGFDPAHIISAKGNILKFDEQEFEVDPTTLKLRGASNPYYALREIVPQNAISRNYAGGLIGYLSYEALNYFEPSLKVKIHEKFDQFKFGVYLDGIVLDKVTNELFYFFYENNRIELVKRIISFSGKAPDQDDHSNVIPAKAGIQKENGSPIKSGMTGKKLEVKALGDTLSKEEHKEAVLAVKEEITKGNTFQCEVGFKTEFKIAGNPLGIYENLRKINPSPFMYYLKFDSQIIVGASPELLFRLRDGEMETYPLAGTIKRGKNEEEDKKLAQMLLSDPKEIAEHNMLVDLHRNDIGRVAQFGTVKVRNFMDIKKFSHVQHISSEIIGLIDSKEDMFSALASNFPAGTLSGAPKIESIKIIDRLEKEARGPYGGGVGHFGFNGDCTFAIDIRSLFISGDYAYTQTSSGIVYDSEPENEYQEVVNKLAAMKEALKGGMASTGSAKNDSSLSASRRDSLI